VALAHISVRHEANSVIAEALKLRLSVIAHRS
jgi:hypothetical protein